MVRRPGHQSYVGAAGHPQPTRRACGSCRGRSHQVRCRRPMTALRAREIQQREPEWRAAVEPGGYAEAWLTGKRLAGMKLPGAPASESGWWHLARRTGLRRLGRARSRLGGGLEYSPQMILEALVCAGKRRAAAELARRLAASVAPVAVVDQAAP